MAAVALLKQITNGEEKKRDVRVQPELIVRESTARVQR
jgi:DNA-binding LacI/PurR family transcriptional regulator